MMAEKGRVTILERLGIRKSSLEFADISKRNYFELKGIMLEQLRFHVESLEPEEQKEFLGELGKALFDDWAINYRVDMAAHLHAAKKALDLSAEGIFVDGFVNARKGRIVVFDPAVGEGLVTRHLMKLLRRNSPKTKFDLRINDLSPALMEQASRELAVYKPIATTLNVLSENAFMGLGLDQASVDIILLSQFLDVIKGHAAKVKLLELCHFLLSPGGRLVITGEDPSLFSVNAKMSLAEEILFQFLFTGMGKEETIQYIERFTDKNPFKILSLGNYDIDEKHRMFSIVARKEAD